MSGVDFLAAVKSLAGAGNRRRRRCERQAKVMLELPPGYSPNNVVQPDVVPAWDSTATSPLITPPAAFRPPVDYAKAFASSGERDLFVCYLNKQTNKIEKKQTKLSGGIFFLLK